MLWYSQALSLVCEVAFRSMIKENRQLLVTDEPVEYEK